MHYNETITDFFNEMKIDKSIENSAEAICYNKREINMIIARYGMYKSKQNKKICVRNIIGKEKGKTQNLLSELNDLFDRTAESYKKRSVSMLQYNSNDIVEKLRNSLKKEPIELREIEHEKYIIGNNGMHRACLLKVHYLNEYKKCKSKNEIDFLNQKYTINVIVEKIDIVKTYSKYVLSLIDKNLLIEDEIDSRCIKTGNVIMYDGNGGCKSFTNTQLLEYVKYRFEEIKEVESNMKLVELYKFDTLFNEYLNLNQMKDILHKLKLNK